MYIHTNGHKYICVHPHINGCNSHWNVSTYTYLYICTHVTYYIRSCAVAKMGECNLNLTHSHYGGWFRQKEMTSRDKYHCVEDKVCIYECINI